jgi:hypothetical protein
MCRHVARRALRFGFTTGTRIYTTQIHKRLCCCYYSCIEAELPPQIRKDDCIFCHFHAVIRRDWLRTGGPDIRSTDLCTFFTILHPTRIDVVKKKPDIDICRRRICCAKNNPATEKGRRGKRICDSVYVFLVPQGWPHLSFLLSFG